MREALALATDLSVEITYLRTRTEDCSRDVTRCRAIAGKFGDGAEAQLALVQERIGVSHRDCARAVEAYNTARRHQERCEDARLIRFVPLNHLILVSFRFVLNLFFFARNVLTFGIGEVFDIGKFTRSVENAELTMYTAQTNRSAAVEQQDSARVELEAWRAEQRTIEDVSTQLEALGSTLALTASALDEHRTRLADVVNTAFDVSVFFGGLVARTAPWDVITSAPALVAAVMKLQQELNTNARLTGVFITSPTMLNDELKCLAG